jgi:hypothetical protein
MPQPKPKTSRNTKRRNSRRSSRHEFAIIPSRWTRRHIAALRVRYVAISPPPGPVLSAGLLDALCESPDDLDDEFFLNSISTYSHMLSNIPHSHAAGSFVESLLRHFATLEPWLRYAYGAGKIDMYNPSLGHTIRHGNREARWRPDATGFWGDTSIPKMVLLQSEEKRPKWVEETACALSMAQIAIREGQMKWTPVVLSVNGNKGAVLTATVDKNYLSDVEALPSRSLRNELEVEAQSWDLAEKQGRVAFAEAVWRVMR